MRAPAPSPESLSAEQAPLCVILRHQIISTLCHNHNFPPPTELLGADQHMVGLLAVNVDNEPYPAGVLLQ
mgnify:CR=1 FL=1